MLHRAQYTFYTIFGFPATNPNLLTILVYQNLGVEYYSVYFVCKFYANMVPSNEPKMTEKFSVPNLHMSVRSIPIFMHRKNRGPYRQLWHAMQASPCWAWDVQPPLCLIPQQTAAQQTIYHSTSTYVVDRRESNMKQIDGLASQYSSTHNT